MNKSSQIKYELRNEAESHALCGIAINGKLWKRSATPKAAAKAVANLRMRGIDAKVVWA